MRGILRLGRVWRTSYIGACRRTQVASKITVTKAPLPRAPANRKHPPPQMAASPAVGTSDHEGWSHFQEPIHILGAGSMGLLFAASVRSAFPSYPVTLLLRDSSRNRQRLQTLSSSAPPPSRRHRPMGATSSPLSDRTPSINSSHKGIISISLEDKTSFASDGIGDDRHGKIMIQRPRLVHCPAYIVTQENHDDTSTAMTRPFRNLIVTTKAFQVVPALVSVRHRIGPNTRIILLCNGVLAVKDQLLQQLYGTDDDNNSLLIHCAWTSHGAFRQESSDDDAADEDLFHVVHAGRGTTEVHDYPAMAHLLDRAGLSCQSVADEATLLVRLWRKLAANVVINPLTALYQCRNGDLAAVVPNWEQWLTTLTAEVAAVARQSLSADDPSMIPEALRTFVRNVMEQTSSNISSMRQDVDAGRPTEIEFLNGYVVSQGRRHGVDCPANKELWDRIEALKQAE